MARVMKALSNENRLKLYLEIARQEEADYEARECAIREIVELLGLSAPTISHHLKELVNAGLITTRRRGKFLVARINKETLAEVRGVLAVVEGTGG